MVSMDIDRTSGLTLMERRKEETRLSISYCAATLFADADTEPVTAEFIAKSAGVGLRTFYRYFRTKEDAVAPLLEDGARRWIRLIMDAPAEVPIGIVLENTTRQALTEPATPFESIDLVHRVLCSMGNNPALLSVWLRVVNDTELLLVSVLKRRLKPDTDPFAIQMLAVAANTAQRMAVEVWMDADNKATEITDPATIAVRCIRTLTAGIEI